MVDRKKHPPPTINGVTYPSIAEASRQLGISYPALISRLSRNRTTGKPISVEKRMPKGHGGYIDGVYYPSIKSARRELRLQFDDAKALLKRSKEIDGEKS